MTSAKTFFQQLAPAASAAVVAGALALSTSTASAFPIAAAGTEGYSVIVTSTSNVFVTYEDDSAAYVNNLLLNGNFLFDNTGVTPVGTSVDVGSFAVGTELLFQLYVTNTGDLFSTGAASRNADNTAHARVGVDATGTTLVSFEDLKGGPFDYNDMSFTVTNAAGVASAVPEPSTYALLLAGFGALVTVVRRKGTQAN